MEIKNGKNRTTAEVRQNCEGSQSEGQPGLLGTIQRTGSKPGAYQVGLSGEDSKQGNTLVDSRFSDYGIAGKIIGQLIEEIEKQLAYHRQQAESLQKQLDELNRFSENLLNDK